jgi:hypothetical protein
MMSMLCNCCVRELLILARTWFAFGLPSKKPGVTPPEQEISQSGDSLSRPARVVFIVRCAPDNLVHPRTEGNQSLPNGAPTAPNSLGAIKGTPRRMDQYTKHPLNILQRRDFANTYLVHCDRDSSTSLSCNSDVLFLCDRSCLVCVLLLQLSLLCAFLFLSYSCVHLRSFV